MFHESHKYFTIDWYGKEIIVNKSIHSYKGRYEDCLTSRDNDLWKGDYKDILLVALKYGLKSFGKSSIVIEFKDWDDKNYFILVQIKEDEITIVSTLRLKNKITGYVKTRNRVNISKYYTLKEDYHHKTVYISAKNNQSTQVKNKNRPSLRKVLAKDVKEKIINKQNTRKTLKAKDMTVDEFWEYSNRMGE